MDIKVENEIVGSLYCNIKLEKKYLEKAITPETTVSSTLAKAVESHFKFELGSAKFYIKSYRTYYIHKDVVYIEGAELIF